MAAPSDAPGARAGLLIKAQYRCQPDCPLAVHVMWEDGVRALAARAPDADGCQRFAVDTEGVSHKVKMAYCNNPACRTQFPTGPAPVCMINPTENTIYGVWLKGSPPAIQLHRCAGCVNAQYCDKACQKQHWPQHKTLCGSLKAALQADKDAVAARTPLSGDTVWLDRDWRGVLTTGPKLNQDFASSFDVHLMAAVER